MTIFIVEDQELKRKELTDFLTSNEIKFETCEYVYPALRYILANREDISGIILDLGLQSAPDVHDLNPYKGLDVVNELDRKNINIPILINSSTEVDMLGVYSSVYGQKYETNDFEILEEFITFLSQREEQ